ncbi:MAG: GAF domain-containing protein, partial [Clostridiales bacterium]|nr:GAF domain-containing protein [Clostridiales bacterium]
MERVLMILTVILLAAFIILLYMNIQKNKKIEKMSKLYDIGKKITSNIKIKKLIEEIMEIVKKEMDAEASSLYLIDKEKGELWFEVALGDKSNEVKEIRLKLGEGVAGWVALEGKTLNLKDVNNDPRFRKDIGEKIEFKQKAMLTMSVKYMDETIGVIQIINKNNGGHFTSEDEE